MTQVKKFLNYTTYDYRSNIFAEQQLGIIILENPMQHTRYLMRRSLNRHFNTAQ